MAVIIKSSCLSLENINNSKFCFSADLLVQTLQLSNGSHVTQGGILLPGGFHMKIFQIINDLISQKFRFVLHLIFQKLTGMFTAEKRKAIFEEQEKRGLVDIPIFIISFNRLSYLKKMVIRLEKMGKKNIII